MHSATTSYQSLLSSSKLKEKWQDCEKKIRNRPDYNQQICLLSEEKSIYLFGLPAIVKELHATFEKLKTEHETKLFKLTLNQNQIKYLLNVCSSDLKALDEKHKMDGVEIMSKLKNSEILAPINMFENLKLRILEYAQITTSTFDICEPGFASLIQNQKSIIIDKARECRCYVTTKIETTQVQVKVPKAHTVDNNDNEQKIQGGACASAIPTSSSQLVTSVNINMGVIRVCLDDLTTRKDDVIVVNLTSEVLKNAVLKAAGQQVSDELVNFVNNYQTTNLIETSPGLLACKKIIFLQWSPQAKDVNLFQSNKQSISDFVSEAITYAFKNKYKSIAFPAIGCGKFGIKPDIIGEAMISEAERQLIKYPKDNFSVSFVLLPQQQSVYDEFCKQLNLIKSANFSLIPTNLNSGNVSRSHITMPFEQQIVKITLISSTEEHIIRCYNSLLELSKKCTLKLKLSNKQDLKDWTQSTVDKYYKYCLDRKIEPILDISNGVLELNGPKDDVDQAEKYYYELVTETLKQAHKHVLSRGIIWSVELTPNDGQWEQYSYKMNAEIEDAYQRKSPYIDLQNESKEQVRIKFDKNQMCEESSKTTRNIQRKVINQNLPDNWETSDVNCKRVQLKTGSPEYAKVLNLFDVTMRGNYVQIVKIERIQNERWFKQYAAHRDEFNLRNKQNNAINNNEKLLFHGCLDTTADKIVQECFNRSFAGVNGIAYGWGVYFATSALYSHAFAKPNARGERTTFLARVLIGNTMVGDPSIKVPPTGWDTTTSKDQGIFVVYHDAQSYADYLITYK
ncbi:unnamed protein product [Didymodactylos carnosus]|uniref:Poly [ADP-ribose] polymerase n=1 Tax=Didymodactylos carnosus TaxID=1234261 RepID=A0A8S2HBQ4_9BILA|nr:unnamed protein product [Didymodactylos carnosus]CAF3626012.1 unnamed protein product [Didymodactylos carnosus]